MHIFLYKMLESANKSQNMLLFQYVYLLFYRRLVYNKNIHRYV